MELKTKALMSHVLVILNLLFPMVYAVILHSWIINKSTSNDLLRVSINQAFILSSISFVIFTGLVISVLFVFGFKSSFTLIAGEIYYMLIVPLFFVPAILGISHVNANKIYYYPIIGRFIRNDKAQ